MGHEAAGVIEELGEGVTGFYAGQRVTFDSTAYCRSCAYCKRGDINLCDNRRVFGVSCDEYRKHGAFAEYAVVSDYILYPIPDNVSFEQAAVVEPLAIALHGISRVSITSSNNVLVIGAGMIGLLIVAALKAKGVKTVIAGDINENRLKTAKHFGADHVINTSCDDTEQRILTLTGGKGADIAFEAVGKPETVKLSVSALRKGGSAVLIGNISETAEIPLRDAVLKQISIFCSCASAGEYSESLALISQKKIDVDALVSGTAPLSEGQSTFNRLYDGGEELMKIILIP